MKPYIHTGPLRIRFDPPAVDGPDPVEPDYNHANFSGFANIVVLLHVLYGNGNRKVVEIILLCIWLMVRFIHAVLFLAFLHSCVMIFTFLFT